MEGINTPARRLKVAAEEKKRKILCPGEERREGKYLERT
jgi:hypothetical protein